MSRADRLYSVIAHARSGALDRAWRLFREGGFEDVQDEAAVLSVRGRLLKDRALAATGRDREAGWLEAAQAYARAGELSGETYPLINAATLSLLGGRPEQARALAAGVLRTIAEGSAEPDTPYYLAATRAEALLLLGRLDDSRAALAEAMALAPRAWEDHASTLRQFGLILDALHEDKLWLDAHRPPRSLHFAGRMALGGDEGRLLEQISEALTTHNVGFGFGALGAGADVLVAESLLERDGQLHIVLPTTRELFRQVSAARFGDDWARRFDAAIAAADTVHVIRDAGPATLAGVRLGTEVAMGRAVMRAQMLQSEAIQLLVVDRQTAQTRGVSGWAAGRWRGGGRRQIVVEAATDAAKTVESGLPGVSIGLRTMAMLRLELAGADRQDGAERIAKKALPAIERALSNSAPQEGAPQWFGAGFDLIYSDPVQAASAAISLKAALRGFGDFRIGGHYGITRSVGAARMGWAAALPARIAACAPMGAILASDDFAACICVGSAADGPRTEQVGELPGEPGEEPVALFSLSA